jgi:AraC-like DNA-binding protein
MAMLDVGLRGAAVALLALLAIIGLRDARRSSADRYSVLFDICAIAYVIEAAPGLEGVHAWWIVGIRLLSNVTPAVFELWTAAHFSDSFAGQWWRWLPFGLMLGLSVWATASDIQPLWQVQHAAALLLAAVGIWRTLAGHREDLVESRRRSRVLFACGVGLWIATTTVLGDVRTTTIPAVSGVLGLALAATLLRLRAERSVDLKAPQKAPVPAGAVAEIDSADQWLYSRLQVLMEEKRAYRQGGLTLAALAEQLQVAEYRLRRPINRRLGHRNFGSFLTSHRLAEAKEALGDATQARVPVLTIALDAGFQSIGPFNRAFKAQTGETPTEFRKKRLGRPQ